jgi:formate/nitrite transporter FocA (FNT family)
MAAPQPEEIYERTREEGKRRLSRPVLELGATALVGGFDVAFGVAAFLLTAATLEPKIGVNAAHLAGSVAFGIAFVFIVVGRSELFTENFLVPIAGLDRTKAAWYKLAELWALSPVFNILGGFALIAILTSHGVLPDSTGKPLVKIATAFDRNSLLAAFLSAVAAGALITLMTWLVEGAPTMGTRIVSAWIAGAVLTLAAFNHVIVVTLEYIMGIRYGAPVGWEDLFANFGTALLGNMIGGIGLVTLTRFSQARSSGGGGGASASD